MEDSVVLLERNFYGHPLAGLLWERQFEKVLLKYGWEKVSNWECLFVHREKGLFLSVHVDDIKFGLKETNLDPMWKLLNTEVDLGEPTSFLDHVEPCSNREFPREEQKNCHSLKIFVFLHGLMTWLVMHRSVWNDIVSWRTRRLSIYKVSTPCIDDHHFKEEEMKSVVELSQVCSQIVLKCLYLARVGRPDILWSVNKLAPSITKWTKASDKRPNRLIAYIHHTCEYKQYCFVGNTVKQCRLGLFQDCLRGKVLKIRNPLLEEHCAFSDVIHLFQKV